MPSHITARRSHSDTPPAWNPRCHPGRPGEESGAGRRPRRYSIDLESDTDAEPRVVRPAAGPGQAGAATDPAAEERVVKRILRAAWRRAVTQPGTTAGPTGPGPAFN